MQEDRFWLLVSLKLSGEATAAELKELEAILKTNPELGLRLEVLHSLWNEAPAGPSARISDAIDRHLQRLSCHLSAPVLNYEDAGTREETEMTEQTAEIVRRPVRWLWALAGIAASLTAFFVFLYQWAPKKRPVETAQNTISTKRGSKSKIQLPDGSQVWLNGDSRIVYDEAFRGPLREVQIFGEAYFDIAKDKDHPFVIHASSIDIRVLGTTLNIRSYCNEKKTETVLIGGSIEVTLHNSHDRIILKPNEKLVVQNGNASIVPGRPGTARVDAQQPVMTLGKAHYSQKDSTATEILWTKNKLAFDQETLEDVALKLERWYDIKVVITDESLRHTAYSAVFEDESLRQVMEALRLTGNFRYSINRKTVTIAQ